MEFHTITKPKAQIHAALYCNKKIIISIEYKAKCQSNWIWIYTFMFWNYMKLCCTFQWKGFSWVRGWIKPIDPSSSSARHSGWMNRTEATAAETAVETRSVRSLYERSPAPVHPGKTHTWSRKILPISPWFISILSVYINLKLVARDIKWATL